jgi:hypothetical protein
MRELDGDDKGKNVRNEIDDTHNIPGIDGI